VRKRITIFANSSLYAYNKSCHGTETYPLIFKNIKTNLKSYLIYPNQICYIMWMFPNKNIHQVFSSFLK